MRKGVGKRGKGEEMGDGGEKGGQERRGERKRGRVRERYLYPCPPPSFPCLSPLKFPCFRFKMLTVFPCPDLLDGFRALETFRKRTKTTKRTVKHPAGLKKNSKRITNQPNP